MGKKKKNKQNKKKPQPVSTVKNNVKKLPEEIAPIESAELSDNHKETNRNLVELKQKEATLTEREESLRKKENDHNVKEMKLATKETQLKSFQTELKGKESLLSGKEKELTKREAKASAGYIEEEQNMIKEIRKEFDDIQLKNKQEKRDLLDRENEITTREANAKAGFVTEQQNIQNEFNQILEEKQEEYDKLCQKMADAEQAHHQKLCQEKDHFIQEKNSFFNDQKAQLQQKQEELDAAQAQLNEDLEKCQHKQKKLDILKQFQNEKTKELEESFKAELQRLNKDFKECQDRSNEEKHELQRELCQFADLKQSLCDAGISDVQEELKKNRAEIKELKAKLQAAPQKELIDENEDLRLSIEEKDEIISQHFTEIQELKNSQHLMSMSVSEKNNLAQQNKQLKLHNQILEQGIKEMKNTMDDLMEQHKEKKVFPALIQIDKDNDIEASDIKPIESLKDLVNHLRTGLTQVYPDTPLYYRESDIRKFVAGLAMSKLHIIHGLSGTGKTSLAKAFAKIVGGHCTDVSVQAGWRDKNDFIGYYNAFERKFYESEALQGIYLAQQPQYQDRINVILLDEMNLSKPEYYFSDFLSALEKRPDERLIVLKENESPDSPKSLIEGRKLLVPENLWFIGTANHDETTNEFADKTYDRAHVMQLSRSDKTNDDQSYEKNKIFSFKSLNDLFKRAQDKYEPEIVNIFEELGKSKLKTILKNNFTTSWGPRFEKQAKHFIPVVMAAGGTTSEALDHLFASKIFRSGKVTGRYTTTKEELKEVESALDELCKNCKYDLFEKTQTCIENDRKRMERGA